MQIRNETESPWTKGGRAGLSPGCMGHEGRNSREVPRCCVSNVDRAR